MPENMKRTARSLTCRGDHNRPVKAAAVVSWPTGRYNTESACIGHLDYLVRLALDNDEPVTIRPISKDVES